MNNMDVYERVREVPENAKKEIKAGRLKGMTDINPLWRIKTLTEIFGMCGIGWYYDVTRQWIEEVGNEIIACVNINLYVKSDGEWSKPIFGTGGSKLSTMERGGLYVSDECYKMATTDAISVACKSLGIGADVYWSADKTKYSSFADEQKEDAEEQKRAEAELNQIGNSKIGEEKLKALLARCERDGVDPKKITTLYKVSSLADLTELKFANIHEHWEKIKGA